jgi:hypothetical protein
VSIDHGQLKNAIVVRPTIEADGNGLGGRAAGQATGGLFPVMSEKTSMTTKIRRQTLAIQAAVPARRPKPRKAAIMAKTRKMRAFCNMGCYWLRFVFRGGFFTA